MFLLGRVRSRYPASSHNVGRKFLLPYVRMEGVRGSR